jgi:hypothetical protein
LRPNGIALRRSGSFLLADLGEKQGGVFELFRDGRVAPFLAEVDGVELPPTNFVAEDAAGRVWITVSTRKSPRSLDYRPDCAGGFIVLADAKGARIVADGIGYTNEAIVSPDGVWHYVNETFGRRLSRLPIRPDGSLGVKEVVTAFGTGTYPDGLTSDAQGHVWITSIVSNRVIRVAPNGAQQLVLEDADPAHVEECEAAYVSGTLGRAHLDGHRPPAPQHRASRRRPDLRTAYLGASSATRSRCSTARRRIRRRTGGTDGRCRPPRATPPRRRPRAGAARLARRRSVPAIRKRILDNAYPPATRHSSNRSQRAGLSRTPCARR